MTDRGVASLSPWHRCGRGALAALALGVGAALACHHPVAPWALLLGFLSWCAVVAWRPTLWLFVLPAALPVLNFAPWTGWTVVDEFDLLWLGVVGGAHARMVCESHVLGVRSVDRPAPARTFVVAAWGFAAASTVAFVLGLSAAKGGAFSLFQGYAEPLNAWRVFKSVVMAATLWPLLRREVQSDPSATVRHLGWGMVAGLGVVSLAVLWERLAYTGLWDFSSRYRTTALFWEMHVGGAAIDAYLALATPFVVWALWITRTPLRWAVLAALALLTAYACLTTFSRGVYGAVLGTLLLLVFLMRWRRWPALRIRWRALAGIALSVVLALEVAAVLGLGSYMRERIGSSDQDLDSRRQHWQNGLNLIHGPTGWLFGIGAGRLPASYAREVPRREFPGDVQFIRPQAAQESSFVRVLGPRTRSDIDGLFALTQRVSLNPGGMRVVTFDARAAVQTDVYVSLCELHLLYPRRCQSAWLRMPPTGSQWQRGAVVLQGPTLSVGSAWAPRQGVFSVSVFDAGRQIDIRRLSLAGLNRVEQLVNGDFAQGMARWFPSAQGYYVPWHIDNLWLELLIERGLFAMVAFAVCMACAVWSLVAAIRRRDRTSPPIAPFLAASLCGGLCIGLISSVMDVPRVALLLMLLAILSVELSAVPNDRRAVPPAAG
jgi:hypothetical protein